MYNFKPGQRLVIELKNACFIGDFLNTNANCTRIDVKNVEDLATGEKFSGVQRYYRSEIQLLTPLKSESSDTKDNTTTQSSVAITCLISATELDAIIASIRSAKCFYHTDRAYYAAIEDIKVHPHVGLAVELVAEANVSLISICVPSTQKIYIFDVISLGRIPNDLKAILQSKVPLKIVHNGRAAALALKRDMNVQLQPVFDTLLAHFATAIPRSTPSLQECLQTYLSFTSALWIKHTDDVNWLTRPMDDNRKMFAAQNAAYLARLHSILVQERLLAPFYQLCNEYCLVDCVDKEQLEDAFFDVCCNHPITALRQLPQLDLNYDGVATELIQFMKK